MTGGVAGRRRRWTTLALYLGTVAVYADMYVTQPVLPLLSRDFGVAPAKAGLSVSAVVLAIAVASAAHGALSDAIGRKRVMVGATALLAVPTLACAFAGSFAALVAWRAAQGLLIPGMTAVAVAYVGDEFEPREIGAVVGGYIAASVAGGLAGRVAGGAVAAHLGWRAAFALFAATTLSAAVLMAAALPSHPAAHAARAGARGGLVAHLADRRLAGAYLVGLTLFFGFIGVFTYLPYRLVAPPFGLSTGIVSSVYLVYVAGIAVSPIAGRLSARLAPERLIGAGLALSVAGAGLTLLPSLAATVAGLLVLCAGMFTAQSIAPSYVNVNARAAKGGASALYLAFYYSGGTLGSWLPGLAWQRWGWPGVIAACVAALLGGLAAVVVLCRPAPLPG